MGKLIPINDEVCIMRELKDETIILIHCTLFIDAIKKLIAAYEIIDLTLDIQIRFKTELNPIWDFSALSELKTIKRELNIYYRKSFDPIITFERYDVKMANMLRTIDLRLKNTQGF